METNLKGMSNHFFAIVSDLHRRPVADHLLCSAQVSGSDRHRDPRSVRMRVTCER